jgi:hypothetical protein
LYTPPSAPPHSKSHVSSSSMATPKGNYNTPNRPGSTASSSNRRAPYEE